MRAHDKPLGRWAPLLLVGLVIAVAILVVNLRAPHEQPAAALAAGAAPQTASDVAVPTEIASAEPQSAQASQADQVPTSDQLVAMVPSSENCIACHTDRALLQQLAEEPKKEKSALAAGEG